jgi:hypothetical protein
VGESGGCVVDDCGIGCDDIYDIDYALEVGSVTTASDMNLGWHYDLYDFMLDNCTYVDINNENLKCLCFNPTLKIVLQDQCAVYGHLYECI